MKIAAPDHPLTLAFGSDGSLDPGTGSLPGPRPHHHRPGQQRQLHLRPLEQTCNLALLTPAKAIPSAADRLNHRRLRVSRTGQPPRQFSLTPPQPPLGNATLPSSPDFPRQAAAPNPLAAQPLHASPRQPRQHRRQARASLFHPARLPIRHWPACGNRTPDCQKILEAVKANAASAVRADATGKRHLPRRRPRHLLPHDLHPLQQPAARLVPPDPGRARPQLHNPRPTQRDTCQLRRVHVTVNQTAN